MTEVTTTRVAPEGNPEVACYHTAVERGYWDFSNAYRRPRILRPPSCDGHAFGGHRDPGAGAGAALG